MGAQNSVEKQLDWRTEELMEMLRATEMSLVKSWILLNTIAKMAFRSKDDSIFRKFYVHVDPERARSVKLLHESILNLLRDLEK